MNIEVDKSDLRQRESKRKIFGDEINKSRLEDKPLCQINPQPKRICSSENDAGQHQIEALRKELEELQQNNRECKLLLKDEREKYDSLFEEYEELIQKNNVIEKEYINLKYQHNKEMKNLKKTISEKIQEQLDKIIEEFNMQIKEEVLWEGIRCKIEKFIAKTKTVGPIIANIKVKKHHKDKKKEEKSIEKLRTSRSPQKEIINDIKIQKNQLQIQHIDQKLPPSPVKDIVKLSTSQVSSSRDKQIMFQDEYYGEIEQYDQYEQKIMQRKNYELLKNCNRSSSDIRRKKIFNPHQSQA